MPITATREASLRDGTAFVRCLQLASPGLPVGGFAYSQGIEWAVEAGWMRDERDLTAWLATQLEEALPLLDVPMLARLCAAAALGDRVALCGWSGVLLAYRETAELRAEDVERGRALARLLRDLGLRGIAGWDGQELPFAAPFALAAVEWGLSTVMAAQAYVWCWLEGQVLAGVKLVPLGQVAGQRLLRNLADAIPGAVARGLALGDDEIGSGLPALAIASSRHETQYTRLFKS